MGKSAWGRESTFPPQAISVLIVFEIDDQGLWQGSRAAPMGLLREGVQVLDLDLERARSPDLPLINGCPQLVVIDEFRR